MQQRIRVQSMAYGTQKTKRVPNSTYIVGGLLLLCLIAGFVLGSHFSGNKSEQAASVVSNNKSPIGESFSSAGPRKRDGLVPTQYEHSTYGAVTAATAYDGALPQLYNLKDVFFNQAMSKIAVTGYGSELSSAFRTARSAFLQTSQAQSSFFRETPIGYNLDLATKNEVKVNLWTVTTYASALISRGLITGSIHSIDLKWDRGDWKVASWTTNPGPTPNWVTQGTPLSTDEFVAQSGLYSGGFDHVPNK